MLRTIVPGGSMAMTEAEGLASGGHGERSCMFVWIVLHLGMKIERKPDDDEAGCHETR